MIRESYFRISWHLYVLVLDNGKHYVGISHIPDKRLQQHKKGQVKTTRGKSPERVALIYVGHFAVASKLESFLKKKTLAYALEFLAVPDIIRLFIAQMYDLLPNTPELNKLIGRYN